MNQKPAPLLALLALTFLFGCTSGDEDGDGAGTPTDSAATAPVAAPTADEPAAAPAVEPTATAATDGLPFSAPLAGGIESFPFRYNVTFDKSPRSPDGARSRVVGLEFFDDEVPMTDHKVSEVFASVGYERALPAVKDGATRSIYTKAGEPDVLVWVRPDAPPGPQYDAMSAGAKGTIYMAWTLK